MEEAHIDLEPGSEWRYELEADENVAVRVHSPDPVYINGEELPPTTWYPLYRYTKGAIYAPTAARIEVTSLPASQYTSTSTIQPHLHSLHLALERLRIIARRSGDRGPRVMVLGPPSSGKTTVVKCLVNMALGTGLGWNVTVAGIDPSSPANLIPGTLSLSTPTHALPSHHLAHPFGSPPASLPSNTQSADVPTLGYWYGALEPTSRGAPIWHKLVASMSEAWRARCAEDANVAHSGLFIDAPSAFTNPATGQTKEDRTRYPLLRAAIASFDVDLVLVIGLEKLTIELQRLLPVKVVQLPKSGGVVDVDDAHRELVHAAQVRNYFYGEPTLPPALSGLVGRTTPLGLQLSPHSFQIGWDTLHVLRVGEGNAAPTSALPLGSSHILSPTRLTRVDPGGPAHVVRLLNTVLAIVAITPEDRTDTTEVKQEEVKEEPQEGEDVPDAVAGAVDLEEDEVPFREEIGWREVLGFVVITAIDTQRRKYTILSPSPGRLPSTVALAGHGIEWVDSA
ncbi:hypothetical protein CC85DRAFT_120653 [Cutaneotrichosporon oleaginosum]|uniref:Polynucleotide 5'-hydroxyl-kinase GRC3 n=1 Tax=Cutaneotrichosporon oleaginosum TaxID=879819 RepID=A0A0J0XK88_9TREE|nr:uncharacterized protein CC85DRAFT_120653 [Cutaneotrichosporon oleaginosum]KLT41528.1 hypothetical protein CC85DRAFT_120653 [Cutaneotrichosporon oleaginosum]TXT05823.1 hypothetical protein COLE_07143 [Cutaneotrichosporon oleaginosum]